ncbi:terminase gpA endonuclease subunit [Vibrio cholerae]|uniref:phage terminase large subunit family protein n=1 Tax=Vibrio cholerae TaxID=666 RepID=UPI001C9309D3|nr:terminase gpA endonuclease subunit [Vibrio cholerae]MBY4642230.1 phage terminase large subunit family protein [Vibrio cholerae]MCR9658502.1 phage terminase large subunit family protein [Vibrio cholerae]MCR9689183.1 phage terminase large subunit family protein [Vibrio cholerae]MCR9746515.1 phage terminase large subunit family protein [Vibrio cholerae]
MQVNYASPGRVRRDVASLIKPPNREPVSKSARRLLHVEKGGAMVPWDGDLVPYMHEPMDCLKSRRYSAVIFAGPARTSKTVSLIDGWICDTIVNNPSDFLLVQISQEKAAEYSKKRLGREFNASPEIQAALSPRAHDNNVHDKVFKAGNFLKIGWPSKTIFASSDWKYVALTDYDRIPANVDSEGSAFGLASKRTQTFMSSGMTLAESSPGYPITDPTYRPATIHEAPPTDGILALYNQGDRRLFFWQCPECGDWFEPDFPLLQWDRDLADPALASKEVFMCCPHCGTLHSEHKRMSGGESLKMTLNQSGLWIPEGCKADQNRVITGVRRDTRIASFWQKGPTAAFQTWNELVYKYLSALEKYEQTGDLTNLQTTVNTDQGKPFTPPRKGDQSVQKLMDRRTDLGVRVVPEWARFLTAAVDVQAGAKTSRWDVMVLAWGADLEHQVIDRFKIEKSKRIDPENPDKFVRVNPATHLEDWDLVTEKVIKKTYELDDGSQRRMPILLTACDSGGEDGVTDNAYAFYRLLKKQGLHRKFMLIKGQGVGPVIKETFPDNTKRSDRKARAFGDVPVQQLNTDRIKDTVSNAIDRETPGRRYCWFPDWLPESFFDELMAEERQASGKWEKISTRNETLDLFVYNWSAIYKLKADQIVDWDNPPLWAVPISESSELVTSDGEEVALPKRRRRRSSL